MIPRVIHHLVDVLVGDVKHRIPRKRVVRSRHGPANCRPHQVAVGPFNITADASCKQSWVLLLPDKNTSPLGRANT